MLLNKILTWTITPSKQLVKTDDRRRAQYLSALLLPMLILTPIGAALSSVEAEQQAVQYLFVALTIAYLFSRTRFYLPAGIFAVISINIPPYVTLLANEEFTQFTVVTWVSWMSLPLLLASLWLTLRPVVFIWFANIILLLSIPIFVREDLSYQALSVGLMQLIIFGSIILLSAKLRNNDQDKLVEQTEKMEAARNEAELSNQAKSKFLATMSHEFRTPLHAILNFSEFGLQGIGKISDENISLYLTRIKTSSERLKLLVDGLLDLTDLENGKMSFQFEKTSLLSVVENCICEHELQITEKQQTVIVDFEKDMPLVECDKKRINQVVMNILDNAIIYSPNESEITISARLCKLSPDSLVDAVKIQVSDQGIGINEDETRKIFTKFYQGKYNNFSTGNSGLGLALSSKLIFIHHGKIWCENNLDTGSSFYFSLPIKQDVHA